MVSTGNLRPCVKCVNTGKWFCNSRHNTLPASCIVYHMVRSRNKEAGPYGDTLSLFYQLTCP